MIETYINATKRLVKTLVIKSETSADVLNRYLIKMLGPDSVDLDNPRSWKYYLNLSGKYHPLDMRMTVVSLDTLEEIEFNVENLKNHSATRQAYRYGTRYYHSLVARYPEQESVIRGILYPVDLEKAIEAKDGSILTWEQGLVEPQEMTLIRDLEQWIFNYKRRWDIPAYGLVDDYYYLARYAVFYMNLVPVVLNMRLRRCRTNEVHSFHIQQYLASKQGLDRFLPYMTLKQALYFYRNIRYLELNAGNTHIFNTLVEKILTERFIPISDLSVRLTDEIDAEGYLGFNIRRKPINSSSNTAEVDYLQFPLLVSKELESSYGNQLFYKDNLTSIQHLLKNSPSSIIQTKDLESNMVDYNNAVPDTFESVLLRQWVYQANNDLYNVVITFRDPKSAEFRTLFAKDALTYLLYINASSLGVEVDKVPSYVNNKFKPSQRPDVDELLSVAPKSWHETLRPIAKEMVDTLTVVKPSYSTLMFFEQSSKIYEDFLTHWYTVSNTHHIEARAYVDLMFHKLYAWCWEFTESADKDMQTWLVEHNLKPYDYTQEEAKELIFELFGKSTGYSIDNTKRLKYIQKALLELFSQLSSYSIQFLSEINDSAIRPVGGCFIRTNDLKDNGFANVGFVALVDGALRVIDYAANAKENDYLPIHHIKLIDKTEFNNPGEYKVCVDLPTLLGGKENEHHAINFGTIYTWSQYDGKDESLQGSNRLLGIEDFNNLDLLEKHKIPVIE